jgi:hypothetical protein
MRLSAEMQQHWNVTSNLAWNSPEASRHSRRLRGRPRRHWSEHQRLTASEASGETDQRVSS